MRIKGSHLWKFFLLFTAVLAIGFVLEALAGSGSRNEGKKLFLSYCSACHGPSGKGDGELSKYLSVKPRDLTRQEYMFTKTNQDLAEYIFQDGEFHGTRHLKNYKPKLSQSQVNNLIAFISQFYRQSTGDPVAGRRYYLEYCADCHGEDGKGEGEAAEDIEKKPTDFTNRKIMSQKTDQNIYNIMISGGPSKHGIKSMPRWDTLNSNQVWDLVAYVRAIGHSTSVTGSSSRGQNLFKRYCTSCHGQSGRGDGVLAQALRPKPRDFTDRKAVSGRMKLDYFFAIQSGGAAIGLSELMPPWGGAFDEQEIWDLTIFLVSLSKH